MRDTVELIVRKLVDNVDAVDVREIDKGGDGVVIEVRVAEDDMGKLIGRQGKTVRAIRGLLHAASIKQRRRYALMIIE